MTLRYGKWMYEDNPAYTVHEFKNREEWLKGRSSLRGIGGSDASAALGMNPWRNNRDLWLIKTGRKTAPDISDNKAVRYGQDAEEYIRRIFQLDFEDEYEVHYKKDCIIQNRKNPHYLYSPDGLLVEKSTGRKGVLEIKTSTILRSRDREKWKGQIPQNYYIQVLHGMMTGEFEFAKLRALLRFDDETSYIKTYSIEREEALSDIQFIANGEAEFWGYVEQDKEPPLIIVGL